MTLTTFDRAIRSIHYAHEITPGSPMSQLVGRASGAFEAPVEIVYEVEGGYIVQSDNEAVFMGDDGEFALTDIYEGLEEVSPPGFRGTVKAMKRKGDVDNPYALAWYMKNKGMKSHRKEDGSPKDEALDETISASQLNALERALDKLFAAANIDVEFTRHFMDRVNDARNSDDGGKPITIEELAGLFRETWKKFRKQLEHSKPNWHAILQDVATDINIPIVMDVNQYGEIELVAKTVMRKKDFTGKAKRLRVKSESLDEAAKLGVKQKKALKIALDTGSVTGGLRGDAPWSVIDSLIRKGLLYKRPAFGDQDRGDARFLTDAGRAAVEANEGVDEAAGRTINVATTPLAKARAYAEGAFEKAGKSLDTVIPKFDENYEALQKKVKKALNIPRNQMPVIEPTDMETFRQRLTKGSLDLFKPWAKGKLEAPTRFASKPEGKAWVELGFKDGDKNDDKLRAQVTTRPAHTLIPTQSQIWLDLLIFNIIKYGPPTSSSPIAKATVIVSKEGYILDGHHRFGQAMLANPTLGMSALLVPLPIKLLVKVGRAYGEAIGNTVKEATDDELDEFFGLAAKLLPLKGELYRYLSAVHSVTIADVHQFLKTNEYVRFVPTDADIQKVLRVLGAVKHGIKYVLEDDADEGINDKYILKAVFMTGGMGSGKSFISAKMFGGTGLKFVNSDQQFEAMMKKAGLSLKTDIGLDLVQRPGGMRAQAQATTLKRQDLYMVGRLGLVLDSTAAKVEKIKRHVKKLRALGYDCSMVFVNTSLDVARARNQQRARTIPDKIVVQDWHKVQENLKTYRALFGAENFREVVNDAVLSPQEIVAQLTPQLTRVAMPLLNKPVKNPVGKQWMEDQQRPQMALAASYDDDEPNLDERKKPKFPARLLKKRKKRGGVVKIHASIEDAIDEGSSDVKTIKLGMSRAMFVDWWASEEERKREDDPDYEMGWGAGDELMDVAPKTSANALRAAVKLVKQFEKTNGDIGELFDKAVEAGGDDDARLFGHYLAMRALGHGVSWEDDNPDIDIKYPYIEYYESVEESEEEVMSLVEVECLHMDDLADALQLAIEQNPSDVHLVAEHFGPFEAAVEAGEFERAELLYEAIVKVLPLDSLTEMTMSARTSRVRNTRRGSTKSMQSGSKNRGQVRQENRKKRIARRSAPTSRMKTSRASRVKRSLSIARESLDAGSRNRLDEALNVKDKAVVKAFTEKRPMEGKRLSSSGTSLDWNGMGGRGVATWRDNKIELGDTGGANDAEAHRALRKEVPQNWIAGGVRPFYGKKNESLDEASDYWMSSGTTADFDDVGKTAASQLHKGLLRLGFVYGKTQAQGLRIGARYQFHSGPYEVMCGGLTPPHMPSVSGKGSKVYSSGVTATKDSRVMERDKFNARGNPTQLVKRVLAWCAYAVEKYRAQHESLDEAQSAQQFSAYLTRTLIPDLRQSGARATAKDFTKVVKLLKSGKRDKAFERFLTNTLIPDLEDSGAEGTAEDFETAVKLMRDSSESLDEGRYKTELEADGQRSTTYREGGSPEDAAKAAVKGWRSDASLHGKGTKGKDLYGAYTKFEFRAGRRYASVRIRESMDEGKYVRRDAGRGDFGGYGHEDHKSFFKFLSTELLKAEGPEVDHALKQLSLFVAARTITSANGAKLRKKLTVKHVAYLRGESCDEGANPFDAQIIAAVRASKGPILLPALKRAAALAGKGSPLTVDMRAITAAILALVDRGKLSVGVRGYSLVESMDEDTNAHGIEFGDRQLLSMYDDEDEASRGTFEEWRSRNFSQLDEATGIVLKAEQSKHNPDLYRIKISGSVGKIPISGEMRAVNLGIYRGKKLDLRFAQDMTRVNRKDGSLQQADLSYGTRLKVEKAVHAKLLELQATVGEGVDEGYQHVHFKGSKPVRYKIAMAGGKMKGVQGRTFGKYLGIHMDNKGNGMWVVTHIPTGMQVTRRPSTGDEVGLVKRMKGTEELYGDKLDFATPDEAPDDVKRGLMAMRESVDEAVAVPKGAKAVKGTFYWKDRKVAAAWAKANGWPTEFIRDFEKGYAVQAGNSGSYASTDGKAPTEWKGYANWLRTKDESVDEMEALFEPDGGISVRQTADEHDAQYKTLNDASHYDDGYAKGRTEIWYMLDATARVYGMGTDFIRKNGGSGAFPTKATVNATHKLIGKIKQSNPERVFGMMQGERWSPDGEARTMLTKLGIHHTSMSVGDVIKTGTRVLFVDRNGFTPLS